MTCDEAAEFISALYDGETIPGPAAEHIGVCETCKGRLKNYMEMGAELRLFASLEAPEPAKPRVWVKPQPSFSTRWQKGWGTMRIPRLAFAMLVVGIVVLGSSLAVVGVRAHSGGTLVMVKITQPSGVSGVCPISITDKRWDRCAFLGRSESGWLSYQVKLLSKDGQRIELGVRTKYSTLAAAQNGGLLAYSDLDSLPEKQYWFEPGETLQVDVAGLGTMAVTGEWMDHMPALTGGNPDLDPRSNELRIVSPLLLRGKELVGSLEGATAIADTATQGVVIYIPGEGLFTMSLSPFGAGVAGSVHLNRLSFESNGKSYAFVTGAPISRSEQVWIRHEPNYTPANQRNVNYGFIGSGELSQLTSLASGK